MFFYMGIVPSDKTLYCIILYRYECYFVKIGIELLNMTARRINKGYAGHIVEHTGLPLHKVAQARYDAALHVLQTDSS
jgi:hypothetical protein